MKPHSGVATVRARRGAAVSAAALLAMCGVARAQPATWASAVTGVWSDSSKWNPAVVPDGPTFDVTIDAVGSLYDVNLDISPTVHSLTLNSADATIRLGNNTINIVGAYEQQSGLLRGTNGGGMTVGGNARFTGVSSDRDVLSAGTLTFNADVLFDCADDVDICDTDVDYNGSAITWQGNGELGGGMGSQYTIGSSTTFTITNDKRFRHNGIGAQPTLINNGTIVKNTGSGTTEFFNVPTTNAGTLEVDSGTIKSNGISTPGNTLTGGTWKVFNGSTLDLVGNTITTNAANIQLRDAGSGFAAINGLATNSTGATFQLSNGRNFTTAAGFTNNGTLSVGPATNFTASSTLAQGSSTITGGGTVQVNGDATFSGPTTAPVIDGGTTVKTQAGLAISGASGLRLDTGGSIQHSGASGSWTGGAISMGDGSSVSIAAGGLLEATNNQNVVWDSTGVRPTFSVAGTFTKKTGTGTTFLSGVSLQNTGTVRVEAGTLKSDQPPVSANTLAGGRWVVKGATLDFSGSVINTNASDVTLDGATASFASLESNLNNNAAGGVLSLDNGKTLTTAGNFTNGGKVVVGSSSVFEVDSGSSFTNFTTGDQTLSSGEIVLNSAAGQPAVFRWVDPAFKVKKLAARVVLSGADSKMDNGTRDTESALADLDTIADVGSFEILAGREFRPTGDLEVQETGPNHGKVVIGQTSLLEIQDTFTLINFNTGTGEIANGDFDIDGTLSFPGAAIRRVNNTVLLKGTGSIINKTTGLEAFGALEYVTARGDFTVSGGKDLDITPLPSVGPPNTLQVDGRVAVGPGVSGNDSVVTVHGNFLQNPGSVVDIYEGGILDIQSVGSGTGNYTVDTGATLNMHGGVVAVQSSFMLNGSLTGDGTIAGNAVVNGQFGPGDSVGRMAIMGGLLMGSSSGMTLDIRGYGAGLGFDRVDVGNVVQIAGGAELTIVPVESQDFHFVIGQVFRVIDAGLIVGHFSPADVHGTELGNGLYLRLDWDDPTALRLVVVPGPAGLGIGAAAALVLGLGRRRRG